MLSHYLYSIYFFGFSRYITYNGNGSTASAHHIESADRKRPATHQYVVSSDDSALVLVAKLREICKARREILVLDGAFCAPEKFPYTVNEADLKFKLIACKQKLWGNLREAVDLERRCLRNSTQDNGINRYAAFVGSIRLGSGFGKTHVLHEAPKLFKAGSVYITFNQAQSLAADLANPRKCILLRVLLRCFGYSNKGCDYFLNSSDGEAFRDLPTDVLTKMAVQVMMDTFPEIDVVVGLDEVARLFRWESVVQPDGEVVQVKSYDCVEKMISEIGNLAFEYVKETERMCTVLATSLVGQAFRTPSERGVEPLLPGKLTYDGVRNMVTSIFGGAAEEADLARICSILIALGGAHYRSVVMAARSLKNLESPSFSVLFGALKNRVISRDDPQILELVRAHVISACTEAGSARCNPTLEQYMDSDGVLPTVFVWAAFLVQSGLGDDRETRFHENHPLRRFFETCAFTDSSKQLEICAAHFDIFRSQHELPVVPRNLEVFIPSNLSGIDVAVYKSLKFPENLTLDSRPLIKAIMIPSTTPDGKKVKKSDIVFLADNLQVGAYYHPACAVHPWVDRAFIALFYPDRWQYLVLYQDKINNDLPKAVKGLNSTADMAVKAGWKADRILCVAHVVDATAKTTCQKDFRYPYVLIRSDELNSYYSCQFAPAIRFVRDRHQLS